MRYPIHCFLMLASLIATPPAAMAREFLEATLVDSTREDEPTNTTLYPIRTIISATEPTTVDCNVLAPSAPLEEGSGELVVCGPAVTMEGQWGTTAPVEFRAFDLFEPEGDAFSLTNATLLAALSYLVYDLTNEGLYEKPEFCDELLPGLEAYDELGWESFVKCTAAYWGLDFVPIEDYGTSTQGGVFSNDEIVIVVFRGTEQNPEDAMTDLQPQPTLVPAWGPSVIVHTGFALSLDSVWDQIWTHLEPHLDKRIWLTGHSLGGSLATLAAMRLDMDEGVEVEGVHTFGQPMVGNFEFKQLYIERFLAQRTWRWALEGDPIPFYPGGGFGPLKLGYHHVGRSVSIFFEMVDNVPTYAYEIGRVSRYLNADLLKGFMYFHMQYDDATYGFLMESDEIGPWDVELIPEPLPESYP
ncbi:MAG: lipase family protein [Deltaproteobacteria bacterium]|nr:lipase family protein [Deltaproteobacteria bacterium]